jgi:acyl-CoA synthetase (AMP-forming)/AMP-acid ligase II
MLDLTQVRGLADVVRIQARVLGEATALMQDRRVTSYRTLDQLSNQVAQRLRQEWVSPQDRIAVLAKNSDVFYQLWFGAMKARVCLAPVNFRLAPPEIAFILADSRAKILFVGQDFLEVAQKALAGMADKPKVIALDGSHGDYADYSAWRDQAEAIDPIMAMPADDDVVQLYTSGTTGHPKGVQLTNSNYVAFLNNAAGVQGFLYQNGETVLNAMPLFHVAGTNVGLAGLAQGCRVVVLKDLIPSVVIDLIQRERVNHAFFVPAVILMLMSAPEMANADLSSMRTVAYGASPITEGLLVQAQQRFGCGFVQFYGMTETVGAGTYLPPEAHDPKLGKLRSCGIPWPGMDVKIVDGAGNELPISTRDQVHVGEIVMRSPMIMKGYYNKPDGTAETIRNNWLHTGDAAYRDADGYFFIYDRVKDMIVTGGENVYPAEVENAIFGHPDVADVAVIGVPDDKWGEAVKAIVVLKPGATGNSDSIITWARERVANYKVPKSVDFVQSIPRNPSGKILRRELRAPYWEGRTRMVS